MDLTSKITELKKERDTIQERIEADKNSLSALNSTIKKLEKKAAEVKEILNGSTETKAGE
jgi:uncharacterized coiled-coil DUF342 family protein